MGTWGPAIFSDDTASDVREQFRDLVGQGLSSKQATDKLVAEWKSELRDPDVAPVFWLALAATQWQLGRLVARVRDRALRAIDDGTDISRWSDDPKLRAARRRHLEKLRATLKSPPPQPRAVRRPFKNTCPWRSGEVVGYRTRSGTFVLLRVIGIHRDAGGDSPVCEVLDWRGTTVPPRKVVAQLKVRAHTDGDPFCHDQLMIGATSAREFPHERVFKTGIVSKPSQKPGGYLVTVWRWLDRTLSEGFRVG